MATNDFTHTKYDKAIEELKKGKRFLVVSHVNPEGDAVGSLLGLYLAIKSQGKEAVAYLEDPVPDLFTFLPGAKEIVHSLDNSSSFDATFAVDCGQKERLGRGFNELKNPGRVINIDHHATNDCFGDINIIIPEASAAGELVYDFCKSANIPISREIAVNLYTAIHTDTGSFRYSSSTPSAFRAAGELVEKGAEPWDISRRVYENHPAKKYKLLGLVLSTLDVLNGGPLGTIATLLVTQEMFRQAGAEKDVADGFVNYARGIEGAEVGILFRECGSDEYKVSLRSKGIVDVSEVAKNFGGGGHRNAAGFILKGRLPEVKSKVINAVRERMAAERA